MYKFLSDGLDACLGNALPKFCVNAGREFLDPVTLDHSSQGRTDIEVWLIRFHSTCLSMCVCVCAHMYAKSCLTLLPHGL